MTRGSDEAHAGCTVRDKLCVVILEKAGFGSVAVNDMYDTFYGYGHVLQVRYRVYG